MTPTPVGANPLPRTPVDMVRDGGKICYAAERLTIVDTPTPDEGAAE
jgi:hypothetical protein